MSEEDMKLPGGKTCKDCLHYRKCARLVGVGPNWKSCDWSPSRFKLNMLAGRTITIKAERRDGGE
jgi:hypothetical protein